MAWLLSNRDGGLTDEQGHYRFQTNVWSGNVIGNGLQVTQNSPLGMSVIVGEGDARVPYGGYAYTAWNDANVTATISTANPSNPRIDRLVLYIDRAETPQQVNPNNPGIPKLMVVAGTPGAVPTRPSNAAVNSAVGATNPWIDLADIRVNAGVTQITNSNITRNATPVAPPASVAFGASMGSTQSLEANTFTKMNFNSVAYDLSNSYNAAQAQFTAPHDGIYEFGASVATRPQGFTNAYRHIMSFYVNGTARLRVYDRAVGGDSEQSAFGGSGQFMLNAGDVVTVYAMQRVGSTYPYGGNNENTWLYGRLVGAL